MKILNHEKCVLVSKSDPLELGIIKFLWILVLWWFCYRSTLLLVMNLKLFAKVFTKLKTPQFLHGLQFLALDIIVGCVIQFVNCLLSTRHSRFTQFEFNLHHSTHAKFSTIMNYHFGIAHDLTCTYNSSLSFSITWIKTSFIVNSMLQLPLYHPIHFNCYVVLN